MAYFHFCFVVQDFRTKVTYFQITFEFNCEFQPLLHQRCGRQKQSMSPGLLDWSYWQSARKYNNFCADCQYANTTAFALTVSTQIRQLLHWPSARKYDNFCTDHQHQQMCVSVLMVGANKMRRHMIATRVIWQRNYHLHEPFSDHKTPDFVRTNHRCGNNHRIASHRIPTPSIPIFNCFTIEIRYQKKMVLWSQ